MNKASRDLLVYALKIGALSLYPDPAAQRKLNSGRMSPYFFNSGMFANGEALSTLIAAYIAAGEKLKYGCIFGPAYKGITLAAAMSAELWSHHGISVGFAFNRKEAKDHGEGGLLVGAEKMRGKRVLITDDVMITGDSKMEALKLITEAGGVPAGCLIAFDREETAKDGDALTARETFVGATGLEVHAATSVTDLQELLFEGGHPDADAVLPLLDRYLITYGARGLA